MVRFPFKRKYICHCLWFKIKINLKHEIDIIPLVSLLKFQYLSQLILIHPNKINSMIPTHDIVMLSRKMENALGPVCSSRRIAPRIKRKITEKNRRIGWRFFAPIFFLFFQITLEVSSSPWSSNLRTSSKRRNPLVKKANSTVRYKRSSSSWSSRNGTKSWCGYSKWSGWVLLCFMGSLSCFIDMDLK